MSVKEQIESILRNTVGNRKQIIKEMSDTIMEILKCEDDKDSLERFIREIGSYIEEDNLSNFKVTKFCFNETFRNNYIEIEFSHVDDFECYVKLEQCGQGYKPSKIMKVTFSDGAVLDFKGNSLHYNSDQFTERQNEVIDFIYYEIGGFI